MKIVLAGTPQFAYEAFENIINHFNVVGIITQPDRQVGRGMKVNFSPIKKLALKYKTPLFQPDKIGLINQDLLNLDYDILLTCAYGQIIPEKILETAKLAALNIHGSLLPKYRGAAPIQAAILNNESITGITLMYMIKQMDAGDMIFKSEIKINKFDNAGTLFLKLAKSAALNIVSWLDKVENKQFTVEKQDANLVSFAPKIAKEDAEITANETIISSSMKVRAYNPFPKAFVIINDIKYKIWELAKNEGIPFKVSDGYVYIKTIQAPNKKVLNYQEFLKGNKL
jgi:methionyl-tRNA formyltransferase